TPLTLTKVAHLLTKEKPQDCGNSFEA
ncbi:CII family transcriptional regulator, partial [Salmonella enterica]